jgi:hypothetical protein
MVSVNMDMTDSTDASTEAHRVVTNDADGGALDATGVYETDGEIVLYDTEQPLAWVQSDYAIPLEDAA